MQKSYGVSYRGWEMSSCLQFVGPLGLITSLRFGAPLPPKEKHPRRENKPAAHAWLAPLRLLRRSDPLLSVVRSDGCGEKDSRHGRSFGLLQRLCKGKSF